MPTRNVREMKLLGGVRKVELKKSNENHTQHIPSSNTVKYTLASPIEPSSKFKLSPEAAASR